MTTRPRVLLLATALALVLTACGGGTTPVDEADPATDQTQTQTTEPDATPPAEPVEPGESGETDEPEAPAGPPVPTFNEPWPAEILPEGFPDLGKVSRVIDSRSFGGRVTIYWNILTESEAKALIELLNPWLDHESSWQGDAFSDGVKYADGTEDEVLRVRPRGPIASASGELEPDFDPQFYLEITGKALPAP